MGAGRDQRRQGDRAPARGRAQTPSPGDDRGFGTRPRSGGWRDPGRLPRGGAGRAAASARVGLGRRDRAWPALVASRPPRGRAAARGDLLPRWLAARDAARLALPLLLSNAYALNQYLASRGFIVLSVNYRSGIGY